MLHIGHNFTKGEMKIGKHCPMIVDSYATDEERFYLPLAEASTHGERFDKY